MRAQAALSREGRRQALSPVDSMQNSLHMRAYAPKPLHTFRVSAPLSYPRCPRKPLHTVLVCVDCLNLGSRRPGNIQTDQYQLGQMPNRKAVPPWILLRFPAGWGSTFLAGASGLSQGQAVRSDEPVSSPALPQRLLLHHILAQAGMCPGIPLPRRHLRAKALREPRAGSSGASG